jgi:hypothetical protein
MTERPFEDADERDPAMEASRPTDHELEVAEHEEGADPDRIAAGSDQRVEGGMQGDSEADLAADVSPGMSWTEDDDEA